MPPRRIVKLPGKKPSLKKHTFKTQCKLVYEENIPNLVRVIRKSGVMCDYPKDKSNGVTKGVSGYMVTINGFNTHFSRLRWMVKNRRITQAKDVEIHHRCGNKLCCRPSHLEEGKKGDGKARIGCKGYIKVDEDTFIKVCTHDPPCRVITKFEDVEIPADDMAAKSKPGCLGRIEYDGKYARCCKHKYCCPVITQVEEEMVVDADDVDPLSVLDQEDSNSFEIMSAEDYKEEYGYSDSDAEEYDTPARQPRFRYRSVIIGDINERVLRRR